VQERRATFAVPFLGVRTALQKHAHHVRVALRGRPVQRRARARILGIHFGAALEQKARQLCITVECSDVEQPAVLGSKADTRKSRIGVEKFRDASQVMVNHRLHDRRDIAIRRFIGRGHWFFRFLAPCGFRSLASLAPALFKRSITSWFLACWAAFSAVLPPWTALIAAP
jgi:hypothetical protein